MAKIKSLQTVKLKGTEIGDMTQFSLRIPRDWVPILNKYVEQKARQNGALRTSDVLREVIYLNVIKPTNA